MRVRSFFALGALLMFAACSGGSQSATPGRSVQEPKANSRSSVATMEPRTAQGQRSLLSLDPDTFDKCATVPTGWACVVQGKTLNGGGFLYGGIANAGQTVTCGTGMSNNSGVTVTTSPTAVSSQPYQCFNAITATTSAIVQNNATFSIISTISGNCSVQGNYCGPVTANGYIETECSISNGHCPVATVTDTDTSAVVSGSPPPNVDWVVGLQKNLSVSSSGGTGTYTTNSRAWTSPTNAATAYNFGAQNTTAPVLLTALSASTLQFYWTAGDNVNRNQFGVTLDLTRSGEEATPSTNVSYLVHTPASPQTLATYKPTVYGPYEVGSPPPTALSSGTEIALPQSAGISLDFKATAPSAIKGYAGGGNFAASQVITGSTPSGETLPAADGCALFTTQWSNGVFTTNQNIYHGAGTSVIFNAIDAPARFVAPAVGSPYTGGDSFADYFMYRPSGPNGKAFWVSLGHLLWSWKGTVTNSGGNVYILSNVINSSSSSSSTSTIPPTWATISQSQFDCHVLPNS